MNANDLLNQVNQSLAIIGINDIINININYMLFCMISYKMFSWFKNRFPTIK